MTPPPLPAVIPTVKLQYVDNIRWIREAAKHQLVRLQLGGGGAVWTLPQVRCCYLDSLGRPHRPPCPGALYREAFQKVA